MRVPGILRWRGLEPGGVYTIWLPPDAAQRSLLRGGIAGTTGALDVEATKGRSISGRLALREGAGRGFVRATWTSSPLVYVDAIVEKDGRYELGGLPEGTSWSLYACADVGTKRSEAKSTDAVPAGATVDLDLTRDSPSR
jgi:hypothetical protein